MERPRTTVLVVDDDDSLRDTCAAVLRRAGFDVLTAPEAESGLRLLQERSIEVVLLDVQMPGMDGIQALGQIKERWPDVEVLMITVLDQLPLAVEAMKLGAHDYLDKEFLSSTELPSRIEKAAERRRNHRELAYLREEVSRLSSGELVLGRSPVMREISTLADRVARLPSAILIQGEPGTGKELLARRIHALSDRASRPFVAVSLAGIPDELLEATLFGQERGAFTGASRAQWGKFELACGGTLFLDEIGELKSSLQARLVRVIQEREVERAGGRRPIPVDFRLITSTSTDLPGAVRRGEFREELYYRLNLVPIRVPALRERLEDLPVLAEHFLAKHARRFRRSPPRLAPEALTLLSAHRWPGNLRELESLCERLVAGSQAALITPSELPFELQLLPEQAPSAPGGGDGLERAVAAFERFFIHRALERAGWNRKAAAARLGVAYSTMKKKVKLHGLAPEEEGEDE